jgi:hypothetical protein
LNPGNSVLIFCWAPIGRDTQPNGQSRGNPGGFSEHGAADHAFRTDFDMALLNILQYPDKRLHKVAKPVAQVDDRIRRLVSDMAETMYDAPGIGLAATQVDVHE